MSSTTSDDPWVPDEPCVVCGPKLRRLGERVAVETGLPLVVRDECPPGSVYTFHGVPLVKKVGDV